MICAPCKEQRHDQCPAVQTSKTWCDCQHRKPVEDSLDQPVVLNRLWTVGG